MKRVTLARDILPWRAGQERILPDDLAAKLEAEGAVRDVQPFPDNGAAARPAPAKFIKTKGRGA